MTYLFTIAVLVVIIVLVVLSAKDAKSRKARIASFTKARQPLGPSALNILSGDTELEIADEIFSKIHEIHGSPFPIHPDDKLVEDYKFDPREIEDTLEWFTRKHNLTVPKSNPINIPTHLTVKELLHICSYLLKHYR